MSRKDTAQELGLTYRHLIDNCDRQTVTAERVAGLLERAREYLAAAAGADGAEAVRARVYFRDAANTLLKRADWIGDDAHRSLPDFISDRPAD